jgi:hypothetical protein
VALLVVLGEFIVFVATVTTADSPFFWVACLQALNLWIAWGIANSVAVRLGSQ